MTAGEFIVGSVELAILLGAIGFGAVRLRGRVLPGFEGASARLVEVVLGLAILVVTLELVGVAGLYEPGWVLAAGIAAGVGIGAAAGRPGASRLPVPSPAVAPYALAIAVGASMLVAAHWTMPTQVGLDGGMYLPNTTWHNAPFAARFVQEAQVGAVHFTEVLKLTVWFYPQNSELLHSAPLLFLGTDFMSPLMNIIWMSLALLAAWSFGRPYGAGALAVLGLALVVDAEMLLLYQPGDAKNDIAGLFFLLAAAAILVNAEAQARAAAGSARTATGEAPPPAGDDGGEGGVRGFLSGGPGLTATIPTAAIAVAGLAAGLALGTKLNLLAPFGLLTLAVIWVADPVRRGRTALVWSGAALVTGGFWFARNLFASGNPLPWFDKGPLPGPDQLDIEIREGHTVAEYLTDLGVIRDSFIPGLNDSFGVLWPLTLAVLVGGFVAAILRGRTPVVRALGVVAAASAVAYLFTPLTAAGPEGAPTAFDVNLRYVSPALGLGALLLALDPAFADERRRRFALAALGLLLVVSAVPVWDLPDGDVWRARFVPGGAVITLLLIGAPVGVALLARRGSSRALVAGAAAAALAVAIGAGAAETGDYTEARYSNESIPADFPAGMATALEWFNGEDITDSRFAMVGGRPGFKQYVFYGDDLSNHVQYVADEQSNGTFRPIDDCESWVRHLNGGDYDYLVAAPDQRDQSVDPLEAVWTGADPAATELLSSDQTFVFELSGPLSESSCEGLPSRDLKGRNLPVPRPQSVAGADR